MTLIKFKLVHTSSGPNGGFSWHTDLPCMDIYLNTNDIKYIQQINNPELYDFNGLYKIYLKDYITINHGYGTYLIASELPKELD